MSQRPLLNCGVIRGASHERHSGERLLGRERPRKLWPRVWDVSSFKRCGHSIRLRECEVSTLCGTRGGCRVLLALKIRIFWWLVLRVSLAI